MSKGKKIVVVAFFALLCALIAVWSVYTYCSPKKETIYVFNNDYNAGKTLTADMLTPIQVDSSIVVNGRRAGVNEQYVTEKEINDYIYAGNYLFTGVHTGQALTPTSLSIASGSAVERNMSSDLIAVTIPISSTTGVTSDLRVGCRVNIYASLDGITTLLLENMSVIKVNKSEGQLVSVTLDCNQEQAIKAINATEYYSVYFGLVSPTDYKPVGEGVEYGTRLN